MVNPFDRQALAVRLADREQEQPVLKAGLKLVKGVAEEDKKTVEAFLARRKENRR